MWLLRSFAISNRLSNDLGLRKCVQFENVPGGIQHLDPIIEALQKKQIIKILYRKGYGEDSATHYLCKPLGLKLFKQRWYLIAYNEDNEKRIYALDRMELIEQRDETFKTLQDFDLQTFFNDVFGIYVEANLKTENIVIKSDIAQSTFLKGLPLHHSQRIMEEAEDYAIFSWRLKPSYDFKQQLITMNSHIEVLQPEWLRQETKALINQMAKKYE